ncbi:MAG: hypothetical protein ACOZBH_03670 [Patescibacteria group bacterium]
MAKSYSGTLSAMWTIRQIITSIMMLEVIRMNKAIVHLARSGIDPPWYLPFECLSREEFPGFID